MLTHYAPSNENGCTWQLHTNAILGWMVDGGVFYMGTLLVLVELSNLENTFLRWTVETASFLWRLSVNRINFENVISFLSPFEEIFKLFTKKCTWLINTKVTSQGSTFPDPKTAVSDNLCPWALNWRNIKRKYELDLLISLRSCRSRGAHLSTYLVVISYFNIFFSSALLFLFLEVRHRW